MKCTERIKRYETTTPPLENLNLKTSHDKIIITRETYKEKNEKFAFHLITFTAFVYLLYDIWVGTRFFFVSIFKEENEEVRTLLYACEVNSLGFLCFRIHFHYLIILWFICFFNAFVWRIRTIINDYVQVNWSVWRFNLKTLISLYQKDF